MDPRADVFAPLEDMPAPEAFTYSFVHSLTPAPEEAAQADVILSDLLDAEDAPVLTDCLDGVCDIWPAVMGEAELRFRLRRWQEAVRMSRELWQTSQYLETTINSVPNLV